MFYDYSFLVLENIVYFWRGTNINCGIIYKAYIPNALTASLTNDMLVKNWDHKNYSQVIQCILVQEFAGLTRVQLFAKRNPNLVTVSYCFMSFITIGSRTNNCGIGGLAFLFIWAWAVYLTISSSMLTKNTTYFNI